MDEVAGKKGCGGSIEGWRKEGTTPLTFVLLKSTGVEVCTQTMVFLSEVMNCLGGSPCKGFGLKPREEEEEKEKEEEEEEEEGEEEEQVLA